LKELGVESVRVDLGGNKVDVSYDVKAITLAQVKEAIEEAGYDVA
jgi:copper chaperone